MGGWCILEWEVRFLPLPRYKDVTVDLAAAKTLACTLMIDHELHDWHFGFDRAKARFGSCRYTTKTITLSKYLVELNDEAEVRDTILHEIAHALTPGSGHGREWRDKCREIGALPVACYEADDVVEPAAKYEAYCPDPSCGKRFTRHRRSRNGRATSCNAHGGFSIHHLLEYREVT